MNPVASENRSKPKKGKADLLTTMALRGEIVSFREGMLVWEGAC